MTTFVPPSGYPRIQVVPSFAALVTTPLTNGCNAICWPRTLPGDFAELVRQLAPGEGITPLDTAQLCALPWSPGARAALDTLVEDERLLRSIGQAPVLECVQQYERDDGPVPTDVYSFHVDRADVPTDTYLCTYFGAASEGLRNDEARRCIDVPALRAQLLAQFGGSEGDAFGRFVAAHSFDLHYAPRPGAQPFSFGRGNLWRVAVQHPGSTVPACIHRAPATTQAELPRLLLIS